MYLTENLRYLRKRDKVTQEELADRLGISRQSVSKWETGEAYPETDKLIALCDLFSVSLDKMVRERLADGENAEAQEAPQEVGSDFNGYVRHMNRFSAGISIGVFLVLIGLASCVALVGVSQALSGYLVLMQSLGVAATFLFDGAAAFLFIYAGIRHNRYRKQNPEIGGDFDGEKKEAFHKRFAVGTSCLVSAIFLDFIVLVVFTSLIGSGVIKVADSAAALAYVTAAFFFALAFVCSGIVYFGLQRAKFNVAEYNRKTEEKRNFATGRKIYGAFCGVVMLIATALYFILSVVESSRQSAWIVFPVGGILCGIAAIVAHAKNRDKK